MPDGRDDEHTPPPRASDLSRALALAAAQVTAQQKTLSASVRAAYAPHTAIAEVAKAANAAAFEQTRGIAAIVAQASSQQEAIRRTFASMDLGKAFATQHAAGLRMTLDAVGSSRSFARQYEAVLKAATRVDMTALAATHYSLASEVGRVAGQHLEGTLAQMLVGVDFDELRTAAVALAQDAEEPNRAPSSDLVRMATLAYLYLLAFSLLSWWYVSHPDEAHVALDMTGIGAAAALAVKAASHAWPDDDGK